MHGNRKRMMVHQHRAVGVLVKVFCDPETFARAQVHLQLLYPPHNGFGGDEDSLGSCLAIRPKPPKKDLVKMMTNDGKILRFEGIPQNNVPEDMHRKCVEAA